MTVVVGGGGGVCFWGFVAIADLRLLSCFWGSRCWLFFACLLLHCSLLETGLDSFTISSFSHRGFSRTHYVSSNQTGCTLCRSASAASRIPIRPPLTPTRLTHPIRPLRRTPVQLRAAVVKQRQRLEQRAARARPFPSLFAPKTRPLWASLSSCVTLVFAPVFFV